MIKSDMQLMKNIIKPQSSYHDPNTIPHVHNSALGTPCASLRFLTDDRAIGHQLIS